MTICANCKHASYFDPTYGHITKDSRPSLSEAWRGSTSPTHCLASPIELNPVSGRPDYAPCSTINKGHCKLFEQWEPPQNSPQQCSAGQGCATLATQRCILDQDHEGSHQFGPVKDQPFHDSTPPPDPQPIKPWLAFVCGSIVGATLATALFL